jgi:hypothetical protein
MADSLAARRTTSTRPPSHSSSSSWRLKQRTSAASCGQRSNRPQEAGCIRAHTLLEWVPSQLLQAMLGPEGLTCQIIHGTGSGMPTSLVHPHASMQGILADGGQDLLMMKVPSHQIIHEPIGCPVLAAVLVPKTETQACLLMKCDECG